MTVVLAAIIAITIGVSVYMLLEPELKGVAMGLFLLSHGANLVILAMSRSPIVRSDDGTTVFKRPPLVEELDPARAALAQVVDPLPQALILTAIVIGFGVMGFLLSLLVVTARTQKTLSIDELAADLTEAQQRDRDAEQQRMQSRDEATRTTD